MRAGHKITAILAAAFFAVALAHADVSDDQIRKAIVAESIAAYPGRCPCPYHTDSAGRRCGGRSAYSRAGGYTVICFAEEVTEEQIRAFRARNAR